MYFLTTIKMMKISEGVKIQIKADIGFMNERPPHEFNKKLIYICFLLETSDGRKVHFARIRYGFDLLTSLSAYYFQWFQTRYWPNYYRTRSLDWSQTVHQLSCHV